MAKETTARTAAASKVAPVEAANTAKEVANAASRDEQALATATAPVAPELRTADGGRGKGPRSSLEGGQGSAEANAASKAINYSVQVHSDKAVGGLKEGGQVLYVTANSGDEAALKVREAHAANYGLSIRGISPASDPDANSMGIERDAAIMLSNAQNTGAIINTLGTDANAEASAKLAKADIKDLGE